MPGPDQGEAVVFALNPDPAEASFASTAMEMRWLDDPWKPGPGRVWMRLRQPLIDDEQASPLARLAATSDFGNGISASLPFDGYLFINADLQVHLHRPPHGEWIGMDARTLLHPGGSGLAESVLHDVDGPVGRAFQALVVGRR
jgi:Thioesterase-like superfamily